MKAAKIEFGGDAIDCMVRDLSVAGAALEVSNQISIPAKFLLAWISTARNPPNACFVPSPSSSWDLNEIC